MEIIVCSKCGCKIPKHKKKKFKFLFWNFEYSKYETDYYYMSQGFGIHLCLDCMKLFQKWLSITPTQASAKKQKSFNKGYEVNQK